MSCELLGSSRDAPVCIDLDSSPAAVVVSPVKLASPTALPECRKLLFELQDSSSDDFSDSNDSVDKSDTSDSAEMSDASDVEMEPIDSNVVTNQSDSNIENEPEQDSRPLLPTVTYRKKRPCSPSAEHRRRKKRSCSPLLTGSGAPIYEIPTSRPYTAEEILELLFCPTIKEDRICKECPTGITHSATFIVDLNKLRHPDDIKKDEFGKWNYSGSHSVLYSTWKKGEEFQFEKVDTQNSNQQSSGNIIQLRRVRCTHPSNQAFQRLLVFVTDSNGDPHHLCLLSYRIPSGFQPLVTPHGNSKSSTPFYPTFPSTRKQILKQSSLQGPKNVIRLVSEKIGGITTAKSPCELPRNERQVTYVRGKSSQAGHSNQEDEIFAIMQSAKVEDKVGKFVRETRPSPEPAFVLARDRQLDDLVRFCTIPEGSSVLTADPTFNLGQFDVTPTSYNHCLLRSVRTGNSPVFIGPTLIHYKKTFHTYLFFASTLIGLRRQLEALRAFGTDGEKPLSDAFSHEFRYAVHLTCFNHCRQNIKREMQQLGYPESLISDVLNDIFGHQEGSTFFEGLVDSSNEEEFESKLAMLKDQWEEKENIHGTKTGFYNWFVQNKANVMKSTMLKTVRTEAGLGSPPRIFTTNASETTNSIIKSHVSHKSCRLMEFVTHLKDIVDEQEREVERAVLRRGKFQFKDEYLHLEVDENHWFAMSQEQRLAHLKKVSVAQVNELTQSHSKSLSMNISDVEALVNIPFPCLEGIWKKAADLITTPGNITPAPGNSPEVKMVTSYSGQRPHLVMPCKSGMYKCDSDCLNYKSMGLCSHVVAVAELQNCLPRLISAYGKSKKRPDFTKLSTHGMPSGRGKKGGRAPRHRTQKEPVTERVDGLGSSGYGGGDVSVSAGSGAQAVGTAHNSMFHITQYPYSGGSFSTSNPWISPFYPQPYIYPYDASLSDVPPMAAEDSPFYLYFITGNISKCAGCGNKYMKPPIPPYDLCVQHREWRSFTTAGQSQSKFAPAYYHVNLPCIQKNWPQFCINDLKINEDIAAKLTPIHLEFLNSLGASLS